MSLSNFGMNKNTISRLLVRVKAQVEIQASCMNMNGCLAHQKRP